MCYTIEILQQILDEEYEGDVLEVLAHIDVCPVCKEEFEKLKKADTLVKEALQTGMIVPPRPIICSDVNKQKKRGIFEMNTARKRWTAAAATIILCGGLFLLEPVRATAQEFLKMFRVEEIKGISINESDIREIDRLFEKGKGSMDIGNFISVDVASQGKEYTIEKPKGIEEIREKMPDTKLIAAPEGFTYDYAQIVPKTDVTLKLDVKKANEFLNYLGEKVQLPETIDQKPFVIHANDTLSYTMNKKSENDGENYQYIRVNQMDVPTLGIPEGVDEKELIQALFSMDFLPNNLKQQLMGIHDLTSTLPFFYSGDEETKKDIKIRGENAVLVQSKDTKNNYFRLCFKENNTVYFIEGNDTIDKVLPLIESME